MKMSTKGRYGLRAMIDLAAHDDGQPVSLAVIARSEELSERYLEQLMSKLKKADLVTSSRGSAGKIRWQRTRKRSLSATSCGHSREISIRSTARRKRRRTARTLRPVWPNMSGRESMTVSTRQ